MNITIVTYEFEINGGGLAYSCRCFFDMLTNIGHNVTIISSYLDHNSYINGGYDNTLNKSLAYEQKLKKDAQYIAPDSLIIAFGGGFNGYYAYLLSHKKTARFWLMLRGSDANISKWNIENSFYLSKALEHSDMVIGLSEEICKNAKLLYPNIRSIVIPNACKRQEFEVKNIRNNEIIIGSGATHLNEKKGVSSLIEMIGILSKAQSGTKITLELVGEIDHDILVQYKRKCKDLMISDKVSFLGRKTREEFRSIQKTWDFYVQASICEGMGNSVVDSMSNGIPVILSNTGYIAEKASKSFSEIVSPSNNADDLANTINNILCKNDIINRYNEFYEDFFRSTNEDFVQKTWQALLNEHNVIRKKNLPSGILSVVLHDIDGELHDSITTPVTVFRQFVDYIYNSGYRLCSMRDYLTMNETDRKYSIVCTFDDGYIGVLENAFPNMKCYGFTATVYVCSEYIGKFNEWNYKDRVKRKHLDYDDLQILIKEGWEIGSHGVTHRSLLQLSDEDVIKELSESKATLEKYIGSIDSYAYPYGDYSDFILTLVKEHYDNAMLLTQGGVHLNVDAHRIRRYYISELYQIIRNS